MQKCHLNTFFCINMLAAVMYRVKWKPWPFRAAKPAAVHRLCLFIPSVLDLLIFPLGQCLSVICGTDLVRSDHVLAVLADLFRLLFGLHQLGHRFPQLVFCLLHKDQPKCGNVVKSSTIFIFRLQHWCAALKNTKGPMWPRLLLQRATDSVFFWDALRNKKGCWFIYADNLKNSFVSDGASASSSLRQFQPIWKEMTSLIERRQRKWTDWRRKWK